MNLIKKVYAEGYQPLTTGLGDMTKNIESSTDLSNLLNLIFQWGIWVAIALAVIMIVLAGLQLMTTDSFSKTSEAKKTISNAVFGLILALSAWIILATIDDSLTDVSLDFSEVESGGGTGVTPSTGGQNYGSGEDLVVDDLNIPSAGDEWAIRNTLSANNITVNKNPCSQGRSGGCTDVGNLKQTTLDTLLAMKNESGASSLVLTGGTESGFHSEGSTHTHVNGYKVDIRPGNSNFDNYIRTKVGFSGNGSFVLNGNRVTVLNEGDHWDIKVVPQSN